MSKMMMVFLATAMLGTAAVFAATTDEIAEMAKNGEPEEKLLAAVEVTPTEFGMGVNDVLRLREAKVPEKVIAAMLRHTGAKNERKVVEVPKQNVTPVQPQTPFVAQPQPVMPVPPAVVNNGNPNLRGKLTLDNLDDRAYAYYHEPSVQTLWLTVPNGQVGAVSGHSSAPLSMAAGTYRVRFVGQPDEGVTVTVYGGENSSVNLARVKTDAGEILQANVFERGERKMSGKLASLASVPTVMVAPNTVYLQQPTIYQVPVYTVPQYYYGPTYYYGGPYYYGPSYYSRPGVNLNFGFGFGSGHRR